MPSVLSAIRGLQAETQKELDALMPSVLAAKRAFSDLVMEGMLMLEDALDSDEDESASGG